eukprot:761612-Hanusia_phi.AAC.1
MVRQEQCSCEHNTHFLTWQIDLLEGNVELDQQTKLKCLAEISAVVTAVRYIRIIPGESHSCNSQILDAFRPSDASLVPQLVQPSRSERARLTRDAGARRLLSQAQVARAADCWFESLISKDVVTTTGMIRSLREELAMKSKVRELRLPLKLPALVRVRRVELKDVGFLELCSRGDPECVILVENYKIRMTKRSSKYSAWVDDDVALLIKRPSSYLRILVRIVERGQDEAERMLAWADLKLPDVIVEEQQRVAKSLKGSGGEYIGATLVVEVESEEVAEGTEEEPSSSFLDVSSIAAATRIFWNLGMPRGEALQVISTIVSGNVSEETGEQMQFWTMIQCLQLYHLNWLSGIMRRWSFIVKSRHLQNLKRKKEEDEYIQTFLEKHQRNMQEVRINDPEAEAQELSSQYEKEVAMLENGMKTVDAFCARENPRVCQVEATQEMVATYRSLRLLFENHQMSPFLLNKFKSGIQFLIRKEKEAAMVDNVVSEVEQLKVKSLIGEEDATTTKGGILLKWLIHKKSMDRKHKYKPVEFYLEPFLLKLKTQRQMETFTFELYNYFLTLDEFHKRMDTGAFVLKLTLYLKEAGEAIDKLEQRKQLILDKISSDVIVKRTKAQNEEIRQFQEFVLHSHNDLDERIERQMQDLLGAFFQADQLKDKDAILAELKRLKGLQVEEWKTQRMVANSNPPPLPNHSSPACELQEAEETKAEGSRSSVKDARGHSAGNGRETVSARSSRGARIKMDEQVKSSVASLPFAPIDQLAQAGSVGTQGTLEQVEAEDRVVEVGEEGRVVEVGEEGR